MREIKFEVLYNNKPFAYERLCDSGWEFMVLELNPENKEKWTKGTILDSHKLIRRQYTGLKDKKGKEIYERDVVKVGNWINVVDVIFDLIKLNDVEELYCDVEVIGNIYETPELI